MNPEISRIIENDLIPLLSEAMGWFAYAAIGLAIATLGATLFMIVFNFVYVALTNAATDPRKRKERKSKLEYVEYYESVAHDEPEDVTLAAKNDYR